MPAMLTALRIRNLALVEDLQWVPGPGFIAVTGETGAGKSVILGALKLVLGERADRTLIRGGADQCSVEAVFSLGVEREEGFAERLTALNAWLEDQGIEPCQEGEIIVKRVFAAAGTNRQFVNCGATTLAVLKELGDRLVDLHGPHDHQSLFSADTQLELLDAWAKTSVAAGPAGAYAVAWKKLRALEAERAELALDDEALARELDLLTHQVGEIRTVDLRDGEEETLAAKHAVAANGRRLLELATHSLGRIEDSEDAALIRLAESQRMLKEMARIDPAFAAQADAHESAVIALEEVVRSVRGYCDSLDLEPERLVEMEERLDVIQSLKRKYGGSVEAVRGFGDEAAARLEKLTARGDELARIGREWDAAEAVLRREGGRLSKLRREAAGRLAEAVRERLVRLGFRQAGFEVEVRSSEQPRSSGLDVAEFVFAPNPGEPPRALRAIASSGEISRVMLALKSALAEQDEVPLLVFDEIDANVGGEIAEAVGGMMQDLGERHQVLCITHLPQVAAKATAQFVVRKEVAGGRTRSFLEETSGADRVAEIARMLGGTGDSAMAHARTLLEGDKPARPGVAGAPRRKRVPAGSE